MELGIGLDDQLLQKYIKGGLSISNINYPGCLFCRPTNNVFGPNLLCWQESAAFTNLTKKMKIAAISIVIFTKFSRQEGRKPYTILPSPSWNLSN